MPETFTLCEYYICSLNFLYTNSVIRAVAKKNVWLRQCPWKMFSTFLLNILMVTNTNFRICLFVYFFLFHFGLEMVRHFCLGNYRVGFNVCCSLHISALEETQMGYTNMFQTNRKLVFLFSEESSPFFIEFSLKNLWLRQCPWKTYDWGNVHEKFVSEAIGPWLSSLPRYYECLWWI